MKPIFDSNMLLSEHFKLSEMLASETAEKQGMPYYGTAEPCRALSRTHAPALRPTHQGHFRLPLPQAQRSRERRKQFPAYGGRGRRHHHPP